MTNRYENQEILRDKNIAKKNEIALSASIYAALSNVKCEEQDIYTTITKTKRKDDDIESIHEAEMCKNEKAIPTKKDCRSKMLLFMIIFVFFNIIFAVSLSVLFVFTYNQINSLKLKVNGITNKELQFFNDTIKDNSFGSNITHEKDKVMVNDNNETLNIGLQEKNFSYNMSMRNETLNIQHLVTLANIVYYNTSNYINAIIKNMGRDEYNPATSCQTIYYIHPHVPSGYFWIWWGNTQISQVYCKKEPYWGLFSYLPMSMRVAKLNKTNNGAECFPGLQQYLHNRSSCVALSDSATCSHTYFSTFNIPYSRVEGDIRAYGIFTPDGFISRSLNINDNYVDGISFTYGEPPNRHHIYTLVADSDEQYSYCNGLNDPNFVNSYYRCLKTYTTSVPLCNGTSCLISFSFRLHEPTNQDIEMRVCRNQNRNDEDIIIEDIELYVQ